jgi:hypothetical protein
MPRREPQKVLDAIAKNGGDFLPCPKRRNRAMVSTQVCQNGCRFARTCPVYQAWRNPGLGL